MKANLSPQREEAFAILRASLNRLNLPPEFVEELIDRRILVVFEKGAQAFYEGNTDGMLGCVLSGYVKVYCSVGDGNRTLVRLAGPGEVIGYPDYIDQKGRHARLFEAQVASKCALALFHRDHVAQLLSGLPKDVLISMLTALNTFWSENLRFFATLLNLPLEERLKIVMSDLARRAGVRDSEGTILIPELGHEDLAEMIGCSRPMVGRLMAVMVASGLLAKRGKHYILLAKWDSGNDNRNSKKSVRLLEAASSANTSDCVVPRGSNRGVAAYAARDSA
jgi:CRP/FNR family transcriptional regulator, cyclic AMP receptor protein